MKDEVGMAGHTITARQGVGVRGTTRGRDAKRGTRPSGRGPRRRPPSRNVSPGSSVPGQRQVGGATSAATLAKRFPRLLRSGPAAGRRGQSAGARGGSAIPPLACRYRRWGEGGRERVFAQDAAYRQGGAMCLQWCYIQGWLIDNDLPCGACPAYGRSPVAVCVTCVHRREGAHGPLCVLTHAPLPHVGGCCHHNADRGRVRDALPWDALPVAPWLPAAHLRAPDGEVWLRLADLAVPLVYGVTADAWETAVALPPAEPIPDAPPHVARAMDVLEALSEGGDPTRASSQLVALLAVTPLEEIPTYWRSIVAETVALITEREHT